jgi:ubiquinone/menaquinone biosynthesis C-methylase UbiE
MKSVSFDRAAEFYDATRSHPPGVTAEAIHSLARRLPARSRTLEVGVGTGRIALPLAEFGLPVTGIDISRKMMKRLREKQPSGPGPDLIEGSAITLPLAARSFAVVLGVHVLHLVSDWREALAEMHRVLQPGGSLVLGYDWRSDDCPTNRLRRRWDEITASYDVQDRATWLEFFHITGHLEQMGAKGQEFSGAEWMGRFSLAEEIARLESRTWSATWTVPEELIGPGVTLLREWAEAEFGQLDRPQESLRRFVWHIFTWE